MQITLNRRAYLAATALSLLAGSALVQAAPSPFTAAQATSGAATYKAQCAMCHGSTLNNGGAPKLAGAAFLKKWSSNSEDDLYYIMSTTMPQTNPGGLKTSQYESVLSYILQKNGFKPGKVALSSANLKKYNFSK
ncbi:cytochrome c (plasmid) [Deinococcus sp. KNUC1210]|uniref:cytochrome c n=1 Tax=Deinococcus sp. KNUC1210 TaxID=2917691 RepID=UPI001EF0BE1D|nr:cytochrome c [Deinococcus sp. KNUC1210]ULH17246.1 cytochrome c [Deinococcus sp. KNUC1210]